MYISKNVNVARKYQQEKICIKFGIIFPHSFQADNFWVRSVLVWWFVYVKLNYFQALERFIIPYNHGIHDVRKVIYWKDLRDNLCRLHPYYSRCFKV